jgi:amino acid transporter
MFYLNHQKRNLKGKTQDKHIHHFQEVIQDLITIINLIIIIIITIIIIIIERIKIKEDNSNLNQKENIINQIGIRIETNNFNQG